MVHADNAAVPGALAQAVGGTLELAAILFLTRLDLRLQNRDAFGVAAQRSPTPPQGVQLPPQVVGFLLKPDDATVSGVELLLEHGVTLGGLSEIGHRARLDVSMGHLGLTQRVLDRGSSGGSVCQCGVELRLAAREPLRRGADLRVPVASCCFQGRGRSGQLLFERGVPLGGRSQIRGRTPL
jgi:hypothetical protein